MSDTEKLFRKAEKLVVSNRLDKAVDVYQEILEQSPHDVSVLNVCGDILVRLNRPVDASRCFSEAGSVYLSQKKFANALAMFRRVHELNPQLPDVTLKLMDLSVRVKDYAEAARSLQHMSKLLQSKDSLRDEDHFKIRRALKIAEEALKAVPEHTGLLAGIADLLRLSNKTELASEYELRLGESFLRAGRYDESLQVLYPLLKAAPSTARLVETIARAHLQKQEPQRALDLLSEALTRDPTDFELLKVKARVLIGCKNYREAIDIHHKLLLRDPASVKDVVSLAESLVDEDHLDESADALELLTPEMTISNKSRIMVLCKRALSRNLNHLPLLEKMAFLQKEMNQVLQLTATYSSLFRLYMSQGEKLKAYRLGQYLHSTGNADESFRSQFACLAEELRKDPAMAPLLDQSARVGAEAAGKTRLTPTATMAAADLSAPPAASADPAARLGSESEGVVLSADLLVKYGARDKAVAYLKAQLQKEPTNIPIHEKLRQFYVEWRNFSEAALQCLALSDLYQRSGDPEKARERLKEARIYDPKIHVKIPAAPPTPAAGAPGAAPVRDLGNLQPGDQVSHFKILSKLGGGGMGVVYRAEDLHLQREVAVKVLSPEVMELERNRERFLQEARSASRLNHRNICVIYGIESLEDTEIIIMEYIQGRSLLEMVAEGPLAPKKVLNYGMQLADALEEAHSKNIIHRDIKSSNILVTERHDTIKVLDFGLAKQFGPSLADAGNKPREGRRDVTQEGTIVGTVTYMSPEQALGEPLDSRSDIFSYGIVLYEIATGKLPFEGQHYFEILYSIVNTDPVPPHVVNPSLPVELGRIIMKAMEKIPRDRYFSARQICTDLEKLHSLSTIQ